MRPILTYHYPSIDSTQHEARRLIDSGTALPFAVMADEQTQGRGREDREWISPPEGNLYATLAFTPQLEMKDWPQYSLAAAVCWLNCIKADLKFKWPNDLLLGGDKLGGILLERYGDALLIGMGLNCNSYPTQDLRYPATSLRQRLGSDVDPKELLELYVNHAQQEIIELNNGELESLRNKWLSNTYNLNNEVSIRSGQQVVTGMFQGIDEQGNLLLEVNGSIECVLAGDMLE